MAQVKAFFKIIEELNCPLYNKGDMIYFDDKSVEFSGAKPSCFILIRELTQLLFKFISGTPPKANKLYGCGGCTGLMKFKLSDEPFPDTSTAGQDSIQESITSGVSGDLGALPPTEVFQALNISEKNGIIRFSFPSGTGFAVFRDGEFVTAHYLGKKDLPAIFAMLKESEGSFHFEVGLADEHLEREQLGNFMMVLMEGMRKIDEDEDTN